MTSTDMSDCTVIYPDNRARILLGLYVIALLIGAYFFLESLEGMSERLEGVNEDIIAAKNSLLDLFHSLLIVSLMNAICISFVLIRIAYKTMKTQSFPPEGTWVLTKTEVQTGRRAIRSAWLFYGIAALVWLSVGLPLYLIWVLQEVVKV